MLRAGLVGSIGGDIILVACFNVAEHGWVGCRVTAAVERLLVDTRRRGAVGGQFQINPPIGRVESPVAYVRLEFVRVADKVLWRVQLAARVALNAGGVRL